MGDSLKMLEFADGKHTGRTIDADIIYMLEDYTGLEEGYCILGIDVTAHSGQMSETDTGGADQLPGQMSIDDYQIGQAAALERGAGNEQAAAEKEE